MDRRAVLTGAGLAAAGLSSQAVLAETGEASGTPARFAAQRWALDNVIKANGVDWDQPRSVYLAAPCGPEASADFAAVRARVQKMADIGPAFESVGRRREAMARAAEADGNTVTARDNWFMAAIHYGAAEWPYDDNGAVHLGLHAAKRAAYAAYAKLADHHIEPVSIPFPGGLHIPAWFHLPPNYAGGRLPVVIAIPGMDTFKEASVALANDRFLSRGIAVLAIDGPGQYEAPLVGLYASVQNWKDAGPALVDYLSSRPDVDRERIAVSGASFGSLFSTILTAHEPRIRACAVIATCLEPGCRTIFEEASPTFKKRFMWMANYRDEAAFDDFCKTLTWEGHAPLIKVPYLVLAGEADELSPLRYVKQMIGAMTNPRTLVVYADSRHSVGGVPSANLGPYPPTLVADWVIARLNGRPLDSAEYYIDPTGRTRRSPIGEANTGPVK